MSTFSSFFPFLATDSNEKITKPLRARLSHRFKMWGSDFVCLFWRENTNEVFFKNEKFARPFWKKTNVVEKWHKPCSDLRQVTHCNTLERAICRRLCGTLYNMSLHIGTQRNTFQLIVTDWRESNFDRIVWLGDASLPLFQLWTSLCPITSQAQAKNTGAQILALIKFCFPQLLQVQCRVHQWISGHKLRTHW